MAGTGEVGSEKRIFIHVGPPKTGSTTLQVWLLEHSPTLLEHGVWYPPNVFNPGDAFGGNFSNVADYDPLNTLHEGFHINVSRIQDLLRRFGDSEAHTLVLSSEIFATDERLELLKSHFPAHTRYIYYVRDPVGLAESTYNQWVKQNECCGEHDVTFPLSEGPHSGLRPIPPTLKNENTDFRPFHRNHFQGGNLITDFLSTLGLDPSDFDTETTPEVNQSLGFAALELKRALNSVTPKSVQDDLSQVLDQYQDSLGSFSVLPPTLRAELSNQALVDLEETAVLANSPSLFELATVFRTESQKPYHPQSLPTCELEKILHWLAVEHSTIFRKLQRAVARDGLKGSPNPKVRELLAEFPETDMGTADLTELAELSPTEVINTLWLLILNRQLDPAGQQLWTEFLVKTGDIGAITELLVAEANRIYGPNPLLDYYPQRVKAAFEIGSRATVE